MDYPITYAKYQAYLKQGKFVGLQCRKCNTINFPPMAICKGCGKRDLEKKPIERGGVIKTFTVIRVAPKGRKPPYVIVMVELDEGPWVKGNLVDLDPERAGMELIGKRVTLSTQLVPGDAYSLGETLSLTFHLLT